MIRPGTPADLDAIAELVARWETHWFGAPEQDHAEVAETLDRIADWSADVRVAEGDGRLLAVAWRWQGELELLADPGAVAPGSPVVPGLAAWLAAGRPGELQVLDRDTVVGDAVAALGWRQTRSAYELQRHVTADAELSTAPLPDGVRLVRYRPGHAPAVHRLVYADAGWAQVVGHHERGLEEWTALFLAPHTHPQPPVVAWRGERPVGVALSQVFSDGTGWVLQLAVSGAERGAGLGRALLLETLRRLRDAGAGRVALGVQAANHGALALYLSAGLAVVREYRYLAAPTCNTAAPAGVEEL